MDDSMRLGTCSIGRAMDILGERWTLLILRECFYGVRRFSVMQRNLGIARNILSARLQLLVRTGILEKRRYQEEPERFEYKLTPKGLDLYPAVVAIMRWGDEHLCEEGRPVLGQVLVTPAHDRDDRGIEAEALLRQLVLEALGLLLVAAALQDPAAHEQLQAGGEDVARDTEVALHHREALHAVEALAQDQQRPALAEDLHGTADRAGGQALSVVHPLLP